MKNSLVILFLLSGFLFSCTKENQRPNEIEGECGTTGIFGPVRYYLTPTNKTHFNFYKTFQSLEFVDSITNDSTKITSNSESQVWDLTTAQTQVQGDTVDFGEMAGIGYNYGTTDIGNLHYNFFAFPNSIDSMRISISMGYPLYNSYWALDLTSPITSNTSGQTPFVVLDSIIFLSRTFHDVYLLQNGNFFTPSDSSNNCYYTKAYGIIAFTDKLYNKFWVRTNF